MYEKKTIFFVNPALAADVGQLFNQVKSALLQKGASAADVNAIQPIASNLLGLGIGKENLVKIVTDLIGLLVNGNSLNSPLQALKDLVLSGEKPGLASNLMSLAINQAKSQNITGNTAVSKIVDFINQKKAKFQNQKDRINKRLVPFLGA